MVDNIEEIKEIFSAIILKRTYEGTPYFKNVPKNVNAQFISTIVEPFFKNFKMPEKYLKRMKFGREEIANYLVYRYYLDNFFDEVKRIYELFGHSNLYYYYQINLIVPNEKKAQVTMKKYPSKYVDIIATIAALPRFEKDSLFNKEEMINYSLEDMKKIGITLNFDDMYTFKTQGKVYVLNISTNKFCKYLGISNKNYKFYYYDLYDYIYHDKVMAFLEENKKFLYNPDIHLLKEFFLKTGLKVQHIIKDKHRLFKFDMHGVFGQDNYPTDIYYAGEYFNCSIEDFSKVIKLLDDYDIVVEREIAHIDYDENGVYFQEVFDCPDPYYDDDEEEEWEYTNEQSEKIYIYKEKRD